MPAFNDANCKTGKIVVVISIDTGHLSRLATNQRTARFAATKPNPPATTGPYLRLEFAGGIIFEEEQRLGALHHQIIDRHGNEVDSDGIMTPCFDCNLYLCANTIIRCYQDRVFKPERLEIE